MIAVAKQQGNIFYRNRAKYNEALKEKQNTRAEFVREAK
jgi:hypothetical protein